MTEKPKRPGVKGKHLDNPKDDRSVTHVLRGGRFSGHQVRLYPFNNGFDTFEWDGETYVAPRQIDRAKPFLIHKDTT